MFPKGDTPEKARGEKLPPEEQKLIPPEVPGQQ